MSETLSSVSSQKPAPADAAQAASGVSSAFAWSDRFAQRHIGLNEGDIPQMLATCGFKSLDALIGTEEPSLIRLRRPLNLADSRNRHGMLGELRKIASQNRHFRAFIRMGDH